MKQPISVQTSSPYHLASLSKQPVAGCLNIIGVAYDGTACFRKGAQQGPDGIRRVSTDLESYSPFFDADLSDIQTYYDLGNLVFSQGDNPDQECRDIHNNFKMLSHGQDLAHNKTRFLGLGGEHSVSYPFIVKYLQAFDDLVLVHLDAHADLRDGYEGNFFSHASIIRRCLDHFGSGHQLAQFGIRSGTKDEFAWMQQNNTLFDDLATFTTWLQKLPDDRPVYLTLDLDFFDPAFLPGTGTPEAGGEDFHTFMEILSVLCRKNLVGADVVELAPAIDPTGNSAVFAAKIVRELILALHGGPGHG